MSNSGNETSNGSRSKLLGWLGWSSMDAIGRLVLMTGSTIVFSRILTPYEFGVSALILTIVTFAAVFVGTPFEDALTQRRVVRMVHLRAALGASWLIATFLVVLSAGGGHLLADYLNEPAFRALLPVAAISIYFSGHSDILTALARRLHRFNDIAYATLTGHIIGVVLALGLAFAGLGIWALVAQRLLAVIARAIILQWKIQFIVTPHWSLSHVRDMARYAGISFLSRLIDNLTYLVFNVLVQMFYGFTVLGYVNMAMRLIEPLRGAIIATSYNLSFSFFARANGNRDRFQQLAETIVSRSAFAISPVFFGLAAISPVLLPMVAGEGWGEAVSIAICLAVASALAVPANLLYSASSARGYPEFNLISLAAGLASIVAVLIGFSFLGPLSVGLSRIAGDGVRAVASILMPDRVVHMTQRSRLAAMAPAWVLAGAMAIVVAAIGTWLDGIRPILQIGILTFAGIAVYGALMWVFARPLLVLVLNFVHKPRTAALAEAVK